MELETLGHAALLLRDSEGEPLLMTDPWLIGSTYWRSWWLQNYPTAEQMDEYRRVKFAYITHEHMDHFHPPSIRKLGTQPTYLAPALPQEQIANFLGDKGFNTKVLEPLQWHQLHDSLRVLSIPLPNDDSVLLLDTPTAFIVNINDSKPRKYQLNRVRDFLDKEVRGEKKIIVLSSYSPASVVNSFRKGTSYEVVSLRDKKSYVHYVCDIVDLLGADFFMPFASQVIFYRSDSSWANAYKVSYDDLQTHWKAKKTQLCRPYSKIDLETFEVTSVPEKEYRRDEDTIRKKVRKQENLEKDSEFSEKDVEDLRKKLGFSWFWIPLLFRRGIGFILDDKQYTYKPWRRKIVPGLKNPSFSLVIPPQALKDVLMTGHFADLGITMFTLIIINGKLNPKLVYVFFLLVALHDYQHLWSFKNFVKWFRTSLRLNKWRIPALKGA